MTKRRKILRILLGLILLITLGGAGFAGLKMYRNNPELSLLPRARKAIQTNDLASAVNLYARVYQKDSTNFEAIENLAQIFEKQGKLDQAIAFWAQAAKLNPLDKKFAQNHMRTMFLAGNFTGVYTLYNSAELIKSDATAAAILGITFIYRNDIQSAGTLKARLLATAPDNPYVKLLDADLDFAQKRLADARTKYQTLLDSPQTPKELLGLLLIRQGNVSLQNNDRSGALAAFQKAANSPGSSLQSKIYLADYYRRSGNTAQSLAEWENLHKADPENPGVLMNLAEMYMFQNKMDKIVELQKSINPGKFYAIKLSHYLNGIIAYKKGDMPNAFKYFEWVFEDFKTHPIFVMMYLESAARTYNMDGTLKALNIMKKGNAPAPMLNQVYALLTQLTKSPKDAKQQEFAQIIQKEIKPVSLDQTQNPMLELQTAIQNRDAAKVKAISERLAKDTQRIESLFAASRGFLILKDIPRATDLLTKCQKLDPANPDVYLALAECKFRSSQTDAAIDMLATGFDKTKNTKILNQLSKVLLMTGKEKELTALTKTLLKSNDVAQKALGYVYQAELARYKNETEKSYSLYEKAYQTNPNDLTIALVLFDINMQKKDKTRARSLLNELMAKQPENQLLKFNDAYWEDNFGKRELAIKKYRSLILDNPRWSLVLVNLSELLAKDPASRAEALELAKQAVSVEPGWWASHLTLSKRYTELGRKTDALTSFQKAQSLTDKNNPYLKEAMPKP